MTGSTATGAETVANRMYGWETRVCSWQFAEVDNVFDEISRNVETKICFMVQTVVGCVRMIKKEKVIAQGSCI